MRIVNLLSDEEIKSLDIQRCPRCRHGFIKDGGCPSVQCFQCKLAFSWEYIQPSNTSTEYHYQFNKEYLSSQWKQNSE